MKKSNSKFGKVLYAILFIILIPLLLFYWAKYTEGIIQYPEIKSLKIGVILCVIGFFLILWGMYALAKFGKGLPMNAYPPTTYVNKGPYYFFRNPIYIGFILLIIGVSISIGSASGLWLITPITILSILSLIIGYEEISLKERFPNEKIEAYFDFPDKGKDKPNSRYRISAFFWSTSIILAGAAIPLFLVGDTSSSLNNQFKFLSIFESNYLQYLSLIFIILVPIIVNNKNLIREWVVMVLIANFLLIFSSLLWPEIGTQHFAYNTSEFNQIFSVAVLSTPVYLILLALNSYAKQFKKIAFIFYLVSIILCLVQLVNSKSPLPHLIVSLFIFIIAYNYLSIWLFLKNGTNKIANSWKEWVFGPIRIINHGFYVGFGSFFGIFIAGYLTGKEYAWAYLAFCTAIIIFSAIWAQLIEGSEKLKRPFGYYGAMVGILFASFVVWLMGYNVWVIIGVASVLMPWTQAIGRFRCLINGCCHGSPTKNTTIGISYFHHRSRVCGLSNLKGVLLHPTQLYAMIWLFFIGFILLALWNNQYSYSFIFGIYLILSGIGRFVEEAYRGEIQTVIWNGLRLYQWTAILSVLIGIGITMIPVTLVEIQPGFDWEIVLSAFLVGLITFIAMGVDFPNSNARFSRLV